MRTTDASASVRLYFLADEPGAGAQTLMYGSLAEAMAMAAQQEAHVQDGLWIATDNDVIAWRDLADG